MKEPRLKEPRFPFAFFDAFRRSWVRGPDKATKAELAARYDLYTITGDGEVTTSGESRGSMAGRTTCSGEGRRSSEGLLVLRFPRGAGRCGW